VTDIHESPVQCLTWSTNGMKLFTGDTQGCVGCTEVDFYDVSLWDKDFFYYKSYTYAAWNPGKWNFLSWKFMATDHCTQPHCTYSVKDYNFVYEYLTNWTLCL